MGAECSVFVIFGALGLDYQNVGFSSGRHKNTDCNAQICPKNSTITVSTRKVQKVQCTCKVLTIVYPLIDRSVMLYLVPGTSISPEI